MLKPAFISLFATAILTVAPASAEDSKDFFFHISDHNFEDVSARHALYRRLEREAAAVCTENGADAQTQKTCVEDIKDRVVRGIDDRKLTRIHERAMSKDR
jgi:UrcA family protein